METFRCFDYFNKKNFHNREKHLWNFRFSHLSASAGPFKDFAADHLKADKKNKSIVLGLLVYANHRQSNNGKPRKFPMLLVYQLKDRNIWKRFEGQELHGTYVGSDRRAAG